MVIYIFRHGIAVNVGDAGVTSDAERMLSPQGEQKTARTAAGLAAVGCAPERILSSPLVRARQTAAIAGDILRIRKIEEVPQLKPGVSADEQIRWLAKETSVDTMLVGHMPDLADLASAMLCKQGTVEIQLKKAAACAISFEGKVRAGGGRLEWLIQPGQLRKAGKKG